MHLFSWVKCTFVHVIQLRIYYDITYKRLYSTVNTNDTCTFLQHEIGICLGIRRYVYVYHPKILQRAPFCIHLSSVHKALSCFHFFGCAHQAASASFCDTHRVQPWNSLPSQAGFVVFPTCRMHSHGAA